jgi:methionyl-tRNA formyltransferase
VRIILVGYGELASSLMLGILESRHQLAGVFRWESAQGDFITSAAKDLFIPNNFLSLIKAHNVHEIKAPGINSQMFKKKALQLQPDVILVGAWGEKIKNDTIILPKIACVNCHPSLLPKHRGPNPYYSAIRCGETKTGITFHLVNDIFDGGEILLQKEVNILNSDTGGSLREKCAFKAREAVKELLDGLENAQYIPKKQDESKASYFPVITSEDTSINWEMSAENIYNQIRSLQPWSDCYTGYKNHYIMINSSSIIKLKKPENTSGKIISKDKTSLLVSTGDPDKGLLINNIKIFGWLRFFSDSILNKIKTGDFLKKN